MILPVSR